MEEEASITYYKVSKCGYYATERARTADYGGLAVTMQQLQAWAQNLRFSDTKTFEHTEGNAEHSGVYLLGVHGGDDMWLLGLWNESVVSDGQFASVRANSRPGAAELVFTEQEPGTIPGFATYFMVIPSHNLIAGVRFNRPLYGHAAMRAYLNGFLQTRSPHAVVERVMQGGELQVNIQGYRRNLENPQSLPEPAFPRFKSDPWHLPEKVDELVRNAHQVARVFRTAKLSMQVHDQASVFQQMLGLCGLRNKAAPTHPVKVRYHLDTTFTQEELRGVIQEWQASPANTRFDDLGFAYRGDLTTIHWLSGVVAKQSLVLNVERDNHEIINPASLLAALTRARAEILRTVLP